MTRLRPVIVALALAFVVLATRESKPSQFTPKTVKTPTLTLIGQGGTNPYQPKKVTTGKLTLIGQYAPKPPYQPKIVTTSQLRLIGTY